MSDFERNRKILADALLKGPERAEPFLARLDAANNELEVRERLAAGQYNTRHAALATEWLRQKEEARSAEASTRAEERETEAITIAKEANLIARSASRWAMWAAIIATIAAVIASKDQIAELISWLH